MSYSNIGDVLNKQVSLSCQVKQLLNIRLLEGSGYKRYISEKKENIPTSMAMSDVYKHP